MKDNKNNLVPKIPIFNNNSLKIHQKKIKKESHLMDLPKIVIPINSFKAPTECNKIIRH